MNTVGTAGAFEAACLTCSDLNFIDDSFCVESLISQKQEREIRGTSLVVSVVVWARGKGGLDLGSGSGERGKEKDLGPSGKQIGLGSDRRMWG